MADLSNEVIASVYGANQYFLTRVLAGVETQQAKAPFTEAGNRMSWILGHIVYWRQEVLTALGGPTLWDLSAAAGYRGVDRSMPATDGADWDELVHRAAALNAAIMPLLADADLSRDELRKTLAGLAAHEGYHVGQMGIARRALGLEAAL
ncbi:MAG: DinB family protein [Gemmatimonadota bacterium]